ncbi:MAG: hypothetical protein ACRDLF_02315 [Solirubrobacteraceae bacterium]
MGLVLAASSSQAHSPIETGQAASTPKTLAQCRAQFKHNRRARAACERRVKKAASTRPASGCTLINTWDGVGEGGDKRDFSVKLKVTGAEPGPYSAQIEVKILNSKVEICSATIAWYEGNGATGQHSAPVTIGAHGGVSSRASLPAGADAVLATVRAR